MKKYVPILLIIGGIILLGGLLIQLFVISEALGFEIENPRFGITGANETGLSSGWPSSNYDYRYVKVFAAFEKPLSKNWYLDIEPGIGLHKAWNNDTEKLGISLNVEGWVCYNILRFNDNNKIYLSIGVGALTMIPSGSQPELGNSGVYGLFGGRVGYRHKSKSRLITDVSLGLEHFSDALQDDDTGRNFATLKVSFGLGSKKAVK